jgi:polyisoprenoid-binding protein YceI
MRKTMTAFAALGLLTSAQAAAEPAAKAGTYAIDPDHTQIVFGIRHLGLSTFYGRFGAVSGTLTFDPAAPEKSTLNVSVDMTNIDTHVAALDKQLRDHFFHAAQYPAATFTATGIVETGDNTGTVTGNLTLAGVTRPVTLNVTFNGGRYPPIPFQPYRLGFDATATIKRSDFGLTGAIWSGMVSDEVQLRIECELEKQ